MAAQAGNGLAPGVADALAECTRYVLFDADATVLAANYQPQRAELQALAQLLEDRDAAIKGGMHIDGQRYEVHRFHPPLAYGRSMGGASPEASVGAALCRVDAGMGGRPCFGAITYAMPNLSARMVPILQRVCQQHLAAR